MFILLAIGLALIVFGGFVLLRHPSATGGKLSVGSLEVSSSGAGLPLIVLGFVAVALAGPAGDRLPFVNESDGPDVASGAGGPCFPDVAAERTFVLEEGVRDHDFLGPGEPLDQPFVLSLTDGGDRVVELKVAYFPANELFKILDAVGADCAPVDRIANESRGGDPMTLQNWDAVEVGVGERDYALRLGESGGVVAANFFHRTSP